MRFLNLFGFIPRPLGRNTSRGLPSGFIPLILNVADADHRTCIELTSFICSRYLCIWYERVTWLEGMVSWG
jgi:hypothetical protein